MTDLELIQNLEQHAGFVINRLTCDGNIYANRIKLTEAYGAADALTVAFSILRASLTGIDEAQATYGAARDSMDSFNTEDWND